MTEQNENRSGHALRGLGALEAQLMEALWVSESPLTVQEVVDALGPGHNYKTVMTVLNRLVEKELLGRELDGRAYRYHPRMSRLEFLRAVADELVHGYLEAYGAESGTHLTDAVDAVLPRAAAAAEKAEAPTPSPAGPSETPAPPVYYDTDERRPAMASVIGIAALLQIITLFLRRKR
ncbi:MAG: BlaI/MecI/CopY family transcriptional regulator [Chloroflexi bacterium]|nr:BlaI/MecI/CopY family transcriptional regulator [Chloroflexota bacterium]MDA1173387.1 BlaI/MecI/CopY family transcriptional regulator [Chloroflexota bacterium]